MILETIWFILVFVLLGGYAVLDGFDLGIGALYLLNRNDHERRVSLNAIGPVWDGNEVWLLTAGGALFAAFPTVYAVVFSGFYIAFMLVLVALMFRAISMEFRSKVESARWRRVWDVGFSVSSLLLPILFGVALGNVLSGVPVEKGNVYRGTFLGLLNPYAVLIGVLTLVTCVMHGAVFLAGKAEGDQRSRAFKYATRGWQAFVLVFALATGASLFAAPALFETLTKSPIGWIFLAATVAAAITLVVSLKRKNSRTAFVSSSAVVASMVGLAAMGLFPRLLPSSLDQTASLTIYNASSTQRTLGVMLVIAGIGMPLVIIYTAIIYRVFRGKVVLTEESY